MWDEPACAGNKHFVCLPLVVFLLVDLAPFVWLSGVTLVSVGFSLGMLVGVTLALQ